MRPAPAMALALAVLGPASGCHVTVRTELTQTRATRAEPNRDQARPQPPAIALADGALRVVEPLVCPSDDVVEVEPEVQRSREPNLATFVVGVIVVAAGGIAAISGLSSSDASGDPRSYGGAALARPEVKLRP